MTYGSNSAGAARGASAVGRLQHMYPSPFFDVANNYMPRSIQETFDWCALYQATNSLISAVGHKLAAYPVTELVYDTSNPGTLKKYRDVFEKKLNFRQAVIEHNLNRYTFGTCINTVSFPFRKMVACGACETKTPVLSVKRRWVNFKYEFTCPKCGTLGPGKCTD